MSRNQLSSAIVSSLRRTRPTSTSCAQPPHQFYLSHRFASFIPTKHKHYDVLIAGGGAVGSVLARLLLDDSIGSSIGNNNISHTHNRRRPLRVALLEQRSSPPSLDSLIQQNDKQSPTPHPRAYALSPTSLSYLGSNVLQSLVKSNRCGVYNSMQVWEHDGPAQLHFVGEDLVEAVNDGRLVDLDGYINNDEQRKYTTNKNGRKGRRRPWLGALVEDAPLVSSLWDELKNDDRIDLLDNVQIKSINAPSTSQMGNVEPPPPVKLSFTQSTISKDKNEVAEECTTLSTNLLVAADGANSLVRRTVGTFPMMTSSYGRKAVTCTVELESSMAQTAFQRFLLHGPIALLPVWNSQTDGSSEKSKEEPIYANVVWSTTPSEANHLLSLSPPEFTDTLNKHLCQGPNVNPSLLPNDSNIPIPFVSTIAKEVDSLLRTANTALTMGTWTEAPTRNYFRMPPKSIGVVSPILGFDLTMSHVTASSGGYTSPRVALVGDAAHTMHPMAGQGLNLGMGDVNSLAMLIKEAVDSGMDVGGTSLFLDRYNQERMIKGSAIVGGVHGLHEIFGYSGSLPGSVADGSYDSGMGSTLR